MKLKSLLKKPQMNEASKIEFKELDKSVQTKIKTFEKILGGKQVQIFEGIHGYIVDIESQGNFGSGYRFDTSTLKKLISAGIRWIEAEGDTISVAF